jgi:hypothetical protein
MIPLCFVSEVLLSMHSLYPTLQNLWGLYSNSTGQRKPEQQRKLKVNTNREIRSAYLVLKQLHPLSEHPQESNSSTKDSSVHKSIFDGATDIDLFWLQPYKPPQTPAPPTMIPAKRGQTQIRIVNAACPPFGPHVEEFDENEDMRILGCE